MHHDFMKKNMPFLRFCPVFFLGVLMSGRSGSWLTRVECLQSHRHLGFKQSWVKGFWGIYMCLYIYIYMYDMYMYMFCHVWFCIDTVYYMICYIYMYVCIYVKIHVQKDPSNQQWLEDMLQQCVEIEAITSFFLAN